MKAGSPGGRKLVAGKDDVVAAFLVVPPVDQIKEKPCVFLVELAMAHFIDDQAGVAYQSVDDGGFLAGPSGRCELITQLGHLDEVCFESVLAALIAESLCQMRFPCAGRADKRDVPVSVYRTQRGKRHDLLHFLSLKDRKVEVSESLLILGRKTAHLEHRLDGLNVKQFFYTVGMMAKSSYRAQAFFLCGIRGLSALYNGTGHRICGLRS